MRASTYFAGACFVVLSGWAAVATGVRVNISPSMPVGVWMTHPAGWVHRGDTVTVCPDLTPAFTQARERGYIGPGTCSVGLEPILKVVVAGPDDLVVVSAVDGIWVNGQLVPNSLARAVDGQGRALIAVPPGRYVVPTGSVWVVNSYSADSFDSRYFGPVPLSNVSAVAWPLLTR
jgi:conjugative transfer signal peptidase TraF